jgi:NitT/TauT family transport system permease protein
MTTDVVPEAQAPRTTVRITREPALAGLAHIGLRLLPGVVFLLFWQWASGRLVREAYVSRPTEVAARLIELFASGSIWPNLTVTAEELVIGYGLGAGCGVVCGYVLGRKPRLARVVEPYLMAFYGIPKIALAPLLVIWFGIGLWSKVVLAATLVFFLMFYSVFAAVRSVDRELVNLALVMGAREDQLGRHVYLPAAMPAIMLGLRMAIPYAVIGVIAGEFVSSLHGLGLYISYASSTYDPAGVFAGIAILLLFVVAANAVAARIEHRVLRWRPESQSTGTGSP